MSRTRIILLRHGETAWNVEGRYQGQLDSALTPTGLAQARALGSRLAGAQLSALYSSDLGRARQTAELIAETTGHEVRTDVRLRERHFGIFQGLRKAELKSLEQYRLFKAGGSDHVIPEGESAQQAADRSNACLEELAARHVGGDLVVVAHGGTLSALLRHTLGLPLAGARRFARFNASWNVFARRKDRWFLETWGDVSHLEASSSGGPDGPE